MKTPSVLTIANIEHWYKGTCFVCQCILSIFPVAISCKYTCSGSRSVNFKMSFSALKGPGQKLSKFSLVFWSKRWFHFEINWPLMLTCFFIGFPSLQGPVIESLVETWLPRRGDWHLEAQVSWYWLLEDCLRRLLKKFDSFEEKIYIHSFIHCNFEFDTSIKYSVSFFSG